MAKRENSVALHSQANADYDREEDRSDQAGAAGCLVRLGWMVAGNAALYLSAVFIAKQRGIPSFADGAFWLVVLACIGLRYLDIRFLKGQTASGEPATLADWRRYVLLLVALAFVLWVGAHAVGFLFK